MTEVFTLGRFGEVEPVRAAAGSTPRPAEVAPGAPAHRAPGRRTTAAGILLDDGTATRTSTRPRYPQGGLSATNTLRVGDTLAEPHRRARRSASATLPGPAGRADRRSTHTNPRPATPADGRRRHPGRRRSTCSTTSTATAWAAASRRRGAEHAVRVRPPAGQDHRRASRRSTPTSSASWSSRTTPGARRRHRGPRRRAQRRRRAPAPTTSSTPASIGTDAIQVGDHLQAGSRDPGRRFAVLDSSVDPRFIDTLNRPSLAQTFEANADGARFTVGRQPPQVQGLRLRRRRRPRHRRRPGQLQRHPDRTPPRRSSTGSPPTRPGAATPTS